MSSKSFFITIGILMICLHQFSGTVYGSPYQLNLKKMFESVGELRAKKDGLTSFSPPDEDVIELEHLKNSPLDMASLSFDNKNSDDQNNGAGDNTGNVGIGVNDNDRINTDGSPSGSINSDGRGSGNNGKVNSITNTSVNNNMRDSGGRSGVGSNSAFETAFDSILDEQIQLENLPSLEKQLEAEAEKDKIQTATSQPEREEEMIVQHRPPHMPYPITPPDVNLPINVQQHQDSQIVEQTIPTDVNVPSAPPKSYHGAARLAFGQHPEVLATTTTTTTKTTTSVPSIIQSILSAVSADLGISSKINEKHDNDFSHTTAETVVNSPIEVPSSIKMASSEQPPVHHQPLHPGHAINEIRTTETTNHNNNHQTKSSINNEEQIQQPSESIITKDNETPTDPIVAELEAAKTNVQRRSVNRIQPKSAESLLRNSESSFDMAQYVFWTGDEAGVARAVEEFIQQGLMSRESALKFLKEIRMGIEYLQKSYANRVIPDQKKRESSASTVKNPLNSQIETGSSLSSSMDFTSMPFKHNMNHHENQNYRLEQQLEQHSDQQGIIDQENVQPNGLNLQRTLDHLPSLIRLQEANSNSIHNKENADYDEMTGRAKIAEFLYAEYSLEEVVYQLAKVMFAQSLTHGSEQAQRALQRLTNFLESEGEQGIISPTLQKKILDVLLAALSDTLTDHPELLATARAKLGHTFLPSENNLDSLRH
ncbi:ras guanine nucleotide exchange factor G isoform X1 [Condylostylus longicornis]|uniref:ras guanine nucleotide exchange factor G isoform X1 n=1 Tax=Condylostylus longicornis TaxID=2530218 RepID=UPI00244D9AC5|nr:ras guanine nucleotide exchange factor G isoform X1 [Condylostylus longicornis]XP_055379608.1 ras guanine nucleotide exchange factor G isoform X1 [Condylostylus longicornis]XP_055379613.1 ras guanine nucleotide exchange factor G isoform X1 [Condylostylus longicornis]XP_055379619.1 ras guanine nucleotide exchange factor G isoform X1 [Condylostylus longicornis]XP_055379625.1 ras guanine nucleotide exchange factor G isoform X1 [Condylostylus longicornis]